MEIVPLSEVRRVTAKPRDSWWTVLLVDPVATPLTRWIAGRTRLTPNHVTFLSLLLGLGAGACFSQSDLVLWGVLLYHCSFILDCTDGKLARLTGKSSEIGGWLDYLFDRIRILACSATLMYGQYAKTGNVGYVWLAFCVVSLDMIRYVNSLQMQKIGQVIREKRPIADSGALPKSEVSIRFSWYPRIRDLLQRMRIRPHLVSGIEFQMAVFIIGPLFAEIALAVIVSGVLLLVFELFAVGALLLSLQRLDGSVRERV